MGGGSPRWAPDNRTVAFDSRARGKAAIFVVGVDDGGPPRQLAQGLDAVQPSWSPDGRWVYFSSSRTGDYHIWKVPAQGGREVQLTTRRGGVTPVASADGWVYYCALADSPANAPGIWKVADK